MATTVVRAATIRPTPVRSMRHRILGWVLIYPLVFFAVHGTPSFESAGHSNVGGLAMSGLASSGHNGGFLGNVVLPGVAFSIVLWTIVINAKRIFALALQMKGLTVLALFTICSAVWSQDSVEILVVRSYLSYRDTIWILFGPKIRFRRVGDPHQEDGCFNLCPQPHHGVSIPESWSRAVGALQRMAWSVY